MTTSEARRASSKKYADKNREKCRAAVRKWNNSEKGRAVRTDWQRSEEGRAWYRAEYARLRAAVVIGYGSKCNCCGESEPKFLAVDHVHGGGRQERKKLTGSAFYQKVIKANFPTDYRLLCHNCNMAVGLYGECPHQCKRADPPMLIAA